MSQNNKQKNGTGVFTLDGTNYGSTSGGPQPLAGLTGLGSGTDFQLSGSTNLNGPGVTTSDGMISPVASDIYKKLYGSDPYIVGSQGYAFNLDGVTPGNTNVSTGDTQGSGNFGMGAPLDPSALGQGAQQHQTGSGRVQLKDVSFTPGLLQQLNSGTSQGNNLISLLQKMKVGG